MITELVPKEIETERLELVVPTDGRFDLESLYQTYSGPNMDEVTRYLKWNPHATPKETADLVSEFAEKRQNLEEVQYIIMPSEPDSENAIAGVTRVQMDWPRRSANLSYWLKKRFWGRGYSAEMVEALIELAFENLHLELVIAGHVEGNNKSKKAIEKYISSFGGQYDGVIRNGVPLAEGVRNLHRYTISKDQYNNNNNNKNKN